MLWNLMRVLFHGYIKSFIAMCKKYFQICRKMAMEEKNLEGIFPRIQVSIFSCNRRFYQQGLWQLSVYRNFHVS